MTVTEDAPAASTAPPEPAAPAPAPSGLAAVLGAGDHKVAGRLWLIASLVHLLLAGVAAALVAAEKIDTSSLDVIGDDWFAQAFTYRSIGGAFLFLLPLTIGIATAVVPLQVGAATIAFPRAAIAAAWTYLIGSGLVVGSYAIGGGPYGEDTDGLRLFLVAFALVLVAQAVAWICIATTVAALRAPGMALGRTPLFAWSTLVAAGVWLLTLPVLGAMVVLTYLDVRYGGSGGLFGGGPASVYDRISWAFHQPTVYAFAIPALGVIASVVPVFAATRHQRHRIAMGLIAAFGALSLGSWALPSFGTDRRPWLYDVPWVAVSFLALVPLLGLLGLWALTARTGRPRLASPLLFAGVAALMLLVGVLAGAVQAIEPIETLVDGEATALFGTTWTTGVASYVVLATATALMGAAVYWAPKGVGRTFPEGGARAVAVLLLLGTVLWSLPDLVAGLFGQPAAPAALSENESTIEALNVASTIGAAVLGLAVLGFVAGLIAAVAGRGDAPGDDPWGGHTLEWATSSPPPHDNFASLPEITSEAPLYDARHTAEEARA